MDINDILARLNKVKSNGDDSWLACCPAHDDNNPSLSVAVKGGKILFHCHLSRLHRYNFRRSLR